MYPGLKALDPGIDLELQSHATGNQFTPGTTPVPLTGDDDSHTDTPF
jgi:hypothetical protein